LDRDFDGHYIESQWPITMTPCPPVVEYSATDQARAAEEVDALPDSAMVVQMLSDYAVLRDQARVCE
jgi:hypothetical protein